MLSSSLKSCKHHTRRRTFPRKHIPQSLVHVGRELTGRWKGINAHVLWSWEVAGATVGGQPVWCALSSTADIRPDSAESAKLQAPSETSSFRVSYLKTKAKWKEERLQKGLKGRGCSGVVFVEGGQSPSSTPHRADFALAGRLLGEASGWGEKGKGSLPWRQ